MRSLVWCLPALAFGVSLNAHATLTFYLDRAGFDAANPGLPIEDFEEASISPGDFLTMDSPLDSTTSNALFSPGDILPGISIANAPGASANGLVVVGDGTLIGLSKAVGNNLFGNDLHVVLFSGTGVGAVAMDLASAFFVGDPLDDEIGVDIFGSSGLLGSTLVATTGPGFFGVSSDAELITRIELNSESEASVFVDNVAFGTTLAVPEPAALALVGLGLVAMGFGWQRPF